MPAFDADLDLTNASAKPNYIPVHTDGTTIKHDGNDATIAGALHALELWMTRTQRFSSLIKNQCVSSHGYIYVDDIRAISIITGTIPDGADRNISRPCPPTAARVTSIALSEYSAGRAVPSFPTTVPDHLKKLYVVNHMRVDEEKASLLQSLAYMFKKADWCDELCENSAGDGLAFLTAVIERGKRASIKDKTAAVALFDAIKRGGVVGEITLESFSTFLKAYRQGLRTLDPATLPSDATESQMVSAIALKDPALRELYEIKAELKPPSNLLEAAELVKSILRSRARDVEIQVEATPRGVALAAAHVQHQPAAQPAITLESLATSLAALAAHLTDPQKNGGGRKPRATGNANGVKAPRNPDNSVARWITGMSACRFCGGQHLNRDCGSDAAKAAAKAKAEGGGGPVSILHLITGVPKFHPSLHPRERTLLPRKRRASLYTYMYRQKPFPYGILPVRYM